MPHSNVHQEDEKLLQALALGNREAAEAIVERLAPLVGRMVFRLTGWHSEIQDLSQEVFLAIQQSATSYRGASQLETWATSITIRCCRRWQRRQGTKAKELPAELHLADHSFELNRHRDEMKEELRMALQALDHDQRELIVLRYLEGHSLDSLSSLLGLRKNTLEVRLLRARKRLGALLNKRIGC